MIYLPRLQLAFFPVSAEDSACQTWRASSESATIELRMTPDFCEMKATLTGGNARFEHHALGLDLEEVEHRMWIYFAARPRLAGWLSELRAVEGVAA